MICLKTNEWQIDNIETVLFDKDGTFIDLHHFWGKMTQLRCEEIIRLFNLKIEQLPQLCLFLGYDINTEKMLSNGITALYSRSKIIEIFKEDLEKMGVSTTTENLENIFDNVSNIFYKNMVEYTKPIDEAIEFIKKIKKMGVKIGIVTSDSIESTKLTLKHFGWENLFDCTIGRECSLKTKESGALTKLALEKLNADVRTTLMIGDAPMDYLAAKNASVENTVLVATGQLDKNKLLITTSYVVSSLSEIKVINAI